MRTLTMNEIEEVGGGPAVIPAIIGAVAVIAAAVIGSCSSKKGSKATAGNGATVECPSGTTATANETTATCQ